MVEAGFRRCNYKQSIGSCLNSVRVINGLLHWHFAKILVQQFKRSHNSSCEPTRAYLYVTR